MSGLGQSNLFSDTIPNATTSTVTGTSDGPSPSFSRKRNPGDIDQSPADIRYKQDDRENVRHHHKAGALFPGNKIDSFDKLEGLNVLMLGGYRGSILRDANTGRRLWAPLRVGFNVRKAELAIGLTEEDELQSESLLI